MAESRQSVAGGRPADSNRRIDAACDAFEAAWRDGKRPRIEGYLAGAEAADCAPLFGELLGLELELGRKCGDLRARDEYLVRFPGYAALVLDAFSEVGPADAPGSVLSQLCTMLGPLRPVLLPDAEGESAIVVKPKSDAMPRADHTGNRYQLSGEIARGGMGAVLRGRDVDLGRDLAVKVLLERYVEQPEVASRFVEEAQIGAQLQHPGIVPVYDIGRFGERPFFTMKLVKGQTLAALLKERAEPSIDRPRFLTIALKVTETLAYTHAKAVIHRDLKPSNVMVGAFGEVQVVDWGLAKVLETGGIADEEKRSRTLEDGEPEPRIHTARRNGSGSSSETEAGSMLGTPAYMSPEQANGDIANLDRRADVFGLGAILCEILTGKPPYVGDSPEEIRYKAAQGDLADARERLGACGADEELIDLTRACLAPKTIDRPKDARAVAESLNAYLDGVQDRLRQAELAEAEARARAIEEVKRRRLSMALAGTILLSMVLGGGGWFSVEREHQQRRQSSTRDANSALKDAAVLREQAKAATIDDAARLYSKAREHAQRAVAYAESGPVEATVLTEVKQLQVELDQEEKDRALVTALENARLAQTQWIAENHRFALERAVLLLREAFRNYGLPAGECDPETAAKQIGLWPPAMREIVLASLNEWEAMIGNANDPTNERQHKWLDRVIEAAEPAHGYGRQVRAAARETDPARRQKAFEDLAENSDVRIVPARALTQLASRLPPHSGAMLLRRAHQRYPDDFWVNHNLGLLLDLESPPDVDEALRYLTSAVGLRPEGAVAHHNLATVLMRKGRVDEAIGRFRRAIEIDPEFAIAHCNLGAAFRNKGRVDEAIETLRRAIALDPKLAPARANLGAALISKGQYDEAIESLRRAIELDPNSAVSYSTLGAALRKKGRGDEAIDSFHKSIERDPKLASAYSGLGAALLSDGKFDEAVDRLQTAIKLDPKLAEAHRNLGSGRLRDDG